MIPLASCSDAPRVANAAPERSPQSGSRNPVRSTTDVSSDWDIPFESPAVDSSVQHTFTEEGADFDPAIDRTGKWLVFASTRHSKNSRLYLKRIGQEVITQLTDGQSRDVQPCFSPDGKRVAFASDRSGNWDIWVIGIDGAPPVQLTREPSQEVHPAWSPDGNEIACSRLIKRGAGELWLIDVEHPGIRKLVGEGLFPSWCPNGRKLVYQRARERGSRWFSIWTLDLAAGHNAYPSELASRSDAALITPTWSPDGKRVTFCVVEAPIAGEDDHTPIQRRTAPQAHIGVVDADGRSLTLLTTARGGHYTPFWSPDDRIFYTLKTNDSETIWSIGPLTATPTSGDSMRTTAAMPRE